MHANRKVEVEIERISPLGESSQGISRIGDPRVVRYILPLVASIVIGVPLASTGQCGEATFMRPIR